jgi:hypothetical protein
MDGQEGRRTGSMNSKTHGLVREVTMMALTLTSPLLTSTADLYTFPVIVLNFSARFFNNTGAYVSGTTIDCAIQSTPLKIAIRPITHLQPPIGDSPRNPPMKGPSVGPKLGARAKSDMARPRSEASNISAITPPALVKGLEPNAPAKKRSTNKLWTFFAPAQAALKAVKAPK